MRAKPISIISVLVSLLWHTTTLLAEDWPCFRGPYQNCTSQETGLLQAWPKAGLNVLWTADLGPGFGGPVVHDKKVYLLDRVAGQKDILRCWDLETCNCPTSR